MSIILGIITSLMGSLGGSLRKKATNLSSLPNSLFVLFGPIIGIIIIYSLVIFLGINFNIFTDYSVIGLLILAGSIDGFATVLEAGILKKVKISKLIPYSSFDKLFIILIGFVIFYGNPGYTSLISLGIAIFTVVVIILFSIDIKNFKLENDIIHYLVIKLLYAISTIILGKIVLEYTTIEIFSVLIFVFLSFHILINLFLKRDFTLILKQTKIFYKYRIFSSTLGRLSFVLGFFIIESSGVLIASLLSFITIVFSIIFMKLILGDTPTKKQILLAILVMTLIGIGYYFK